MADAGLGVRVQQGLPGGRGLVFMKAERRGAVVLMERPMKTATAPEGMGLWPLVAAVLADPVALQFVLQFDESPAAAAVWDAVEAQHAAAIAAGTGTTAACAETVFKRVSTINFNGCIGYNGNVTKMVFHLLSYANHSCEPSCAIVEGRDHEFVLVTRRAVQAGEEATFSYIGHVSGGAAVRGSHLMRGWGFRCACPSCAG